MRKAGGVYYTPEYTVRYICEQTIGKVIEGNTPAQIEKLRFADIASGSSSFLLGIFDLLLRYHGRWYAEHPDFLLLGKEAPISRLNQAVFQNRVAKRMLCDTLSRRPLPILAGLQGAIDELNESAVLERFRLLPHSARNRTAEKLPNVRLHRIVVELHSEVAGFERRPQVQNQCVNEQLLLRCCGISFKIHCPREYAPEFLAIIKPTRIPAVCNKSNQCVPINPSIPMPELHRTLRISPRSAPEYPP